MLASSDSLVRTFRLHTSLLIYNTAFTLGKKKKRCSYYSCIVNSFLCNCFLTSVVAVVVAVVAAVVAVVVLLLCCCCCYLLLCDEL